MKTILLSSIIVALFSCSGPKVANEGKNIKTPSVPKRKIKRYRSTRELLLDKYRLMRAGKTFESIEQHVAPRQRPYKKPSRRYQPPVRKVQKKIEKPVEVKIYRPVDTVAVRREINQKLNYHCISFEESFSSIDACNEEMEKIKFQCLEKSGEEINHVYKDCVLSEIARH